MSSLCNPRRGSQEKTPNDSNFWDLFSKFCASSTIHGTYFWAEARTPIARVVWGAIVVLGIFSATFIINSSFKAWQDHPVPVLIKLFSSSLVWR
jgi:hypothetical protein